MYLDPGFGLIINLNVVNKLPAIPHNHIRPQDERRWNNLKYNLVHNNKQYIQWINAYYIDIF